MWYNWVTHIFDIDFKCISCFWNDKHLTVSGIRAPAFENNILYHHHPKNRRSFVMFLQSRVFSLLFRLHWIFSIQWINFYLTFTFFEEAFHWLVQEHFSTLCILCLRFCYTVGICLLIKLCHEAFRKILRTANHFVLNQLEYIATVLINF